MSKVTFVGEEKLIIVDYGVTTLSVQNDLYSEWKRWFKQNRNSKFLPAMRSVGGDPISDVKDLGATFFLINGWRIRPFEGDHRLIIQGNLFTDPAGDSIVTDTIGDWRIVIEMETSSLVDSTIQQLPQIEYASFEMSIWINTDNGVSGTDFPRGTPQMPVNNLSDALIIAVSRGIRTLTFMGDYTFVDGDQVVNYDIRGIGKTKTTLTFDEGSVLLNSRVRHCSITGASTGMVSFEDCFIRDFGSTSPVPVSQDIIIKECVLNGSIFLPSTYSGTLTVLDCWSDTHATGITNLDMGNSLATVAIRNYSGGIRILNNTQDNYICVDLLSGGIILDETVTNGSIIIRGVGVLMDNSIGGTITNNILDKNKIDEYVWDTNISEHLIDGSTGRALSDAGSAGNPWSSPISGNQQPGTFGEFVSKKLLTFSRWLGLK